MNIHIANSTVNDIPKILDLYAIATAYMKSKNQVSWPTFEQSMIENEINAQQQWKLLIDGEIACIWATTFSDPLIWGVKNTDPSVYIHRITTDPAFRGNNLVKKLIDWAKIYAKDADKKFLRMDTVGLNKPLIQHYEKLGFEFLGTEKLANTQGLPEHYKKGEVCFFEIKL